MFAKVRCPKVVTVNTLHEHNEVRSGMFNKMESTAMCMPCIPLALLDYHSNLLSILIWNKR